MSITINTLLDKANIAKELGNIKDFNILASMADNLKKWGSLTSRQLAYARVLVDNYDGDRLAEIRSRNEQIHRLWQTKDEDFLKMLEFFCFFYTARNCVRYKHHVDNLHSTAVRIKCSLDFHLSHGHECPVQEIRTLLASKLHDTLKETYQSSPKYAIGDLVTIRGRSCGTFGAWNTNGFSRWYQQEQFQLCIVTEIVNGTYRCKKVHPTKGSSRLYKIQSFHGGKTKTCHIEEELIKPMK